MIVSSILWSALWFVVGLGLLVTLHEYGHYWVAKRYGVRIKRFSMLVDDGVVKTLNVEKPGAFEVSDAGTMLKQA